MKLYVVLLIRKSASKLKVVVGQQELTIVDPYEETISIYQIHIIDRYNSTTQVNDVALLQVTIQFANNLNSFLSFAKIISISCQILLHS